MTIETSLDTENQVLTLSISGRFDFGMHQHFNQIVEQIDSDVKTIIVDMIAVEYIDSSALGMLLVLRSKLDNNKHAVQIKNVKSNVDKIFKIANFDQLFTFE